MEVLFRFLNWVSSFHTVDEESGNKMDTWNIATVMAPNILRESNDKEMKNVDQGAVKVVFDLIENNDEFSEVSPVTILALNETNQVRYHRKSWSYSMMTHPICLRRRSCANGSSEAKILFRPQQLHLETKAALHQRRTNATHPKSHQRIATRKPMLARHRVDKWDKVLKRRLLRHHNNLTWAHQIRRLGAIHKTQQRVNGQPLLIGTATGHRPTKNKHRLVLLVQGNLTARSLA
jgi:hypothetical protein